MKVTVIGSHLCPDTLYALNKLVEAKADITFQNLSASLPDLKAYLALRESSPVFEGPKAKGSLGIPCFVREDGTVTLEQEDAALVDNAGNEIVAAAGPSVEDGVITGTMNYFVKGVVVA